MRTRRKGSVRQTWVRPEYLLFSLEEFFWTRKIQRADKKKLVQDNEFSSATFFLKGSALNFSSKKIRQMKAGLNNKYDMPMTSDLTKVCRQTGASMHLTFILISFYFLFSRKNY